MGLVNLLKSFGTFLPSRSVAPNQPQSSILASENMLRPYSDAGRFGWTDLAPAMAWTYYEKLSVIAHAIGLASDMFLTVPFAVKNLKNGEIYREYDHKIPATGILKLLANPNEDSTECDFKELTNKTYSVTGETFMVTTSMGIDDEPLEIFWVNSSNVSNTSSVDDIITSYTIASGQFMGTYRRTELESDGRVVFVNENSHGTHKQLWTMKEMHPKQLSSGSRRGFSKLSPIFMEIESHNGVSLHNNSMLRSGVRPSIALIPKTDKEGDSLLGEPQIRDIKRTVKSHYSGPNNAGNAMILNAIEKVVELSKNNKDMEFMRLVEIVKEQIYRNLGIPLALISTDVMTYSNLEEARAQLAILNTIPFSKKYAEQINRFLMPRYDDSGDYKYIFLPDEIPALKEIQMEKLINLKEVMTDNEVRLLLGLEEREDGNNMIGRGASSVPEKKEYIDQLMDMGYDHIEAEKKAQERYHECT